MDRKIRKEKYLAVQKILHQDLPYINLWHNKNFAVYRKEIKGVTLSPSGSWRSFLTLYKEPGNGP